MKYINPLTGEETESTLDDADGDGAGDGYKHNNWFSGFDLIDVEAAIEYILRHGYTGSSSDKDSLKQWLTAQGLDASDKHIDDIIDDANTYLRYTGINLNDLNRYYELGGSYDNPDPTLLSRAYEIEESRKADAKTYAFDSYYNDLYSLKPGTLGREMLDNYTLAEQHAAMSNMDLAEAQYQQSAMQQAETVKAITDSVKAERMARLRAGMSESQIANQDMQIMLNNMNTLNQNMDVLNQNRYAAQQQYNLAQDTAYQQYINTATNLGNVGAAYSAAGAGSLDYVTKQIQAQTGWKYDKALNEAKKAG